MRLRRSSARGKIDSSLREKLGESRTTGPENSPADTISRATFAPRLCPTTTSHERSAARRDAEPVALHAQVVGSCGTAESGHRRRNEADPGLADARLREEVLVERPCRERAGKKEDPVVCVLRPCFVQFPPQVLSIRSHVAPLVGTRGACQVCRALPSPLCIKRHSRTLAHASVSAPDVIQGAAARAAGIGGGSGVLSAECRDTACLLCWLAPRLRCRRARPRARQRPRSV